MDFTGFLFNSNCRSNDQGGKIVVLHSDCSLVEDFVPVKKWYNKIRCKFNSKFLDKKIAPLKIDTYYFLT